MSEQVAAPIRNGRRTRLLSLLGVVALTLILACGVRPGDPGGSPLDRMRALAIKGVEQRLSQAELAATWAAGPVQLFALVEPLLSGGSGEPRLGAVIAVSAEDSAVVGLFSGDFDGPAPDSAASALDAIRLVASVRADSSTRYGIAGHGVGLGFRLFDVVALPHGDTLVLHSSEIVVVSSRGRAAIVTRLGSQ
jgi:hypothetical protein